MLKIRIWDRTRMHESDYEGPTEYAARMLFTDRDGMITFSNLNGDVYILDPKEFMFDVFGGD